jgi:hypothetical protein
MVAIIAIAAIWWLAKPGGAESGRSAAERSRAMLVQVEQEVQQRNAREISPGETRTAREIQDDAEQAFQTGDYRTAQLLFDRSRAVYERVLVTATATHALAETGGGTAVTEAAAADLARDTQAPPPAKVVTTPPPEPPSRADAAAREQLQRMDDARLAAIAADATLYARNEYDKAEARAAFGNRQVEAGDYVSAEAAFVDAEAEFRAAESAAAAQKSQIEDRGAQLRARVEKRRIELDSHRGMELYAQAIELERDAKEKESHDPAGALAAYQQALERLESAATKRSRDDRELRELVAAYEDALEGEDIARMRNLHNSLSSDDEETWKTFFGAVNELDAKMLVDEIVFDGDRATVDVLVTLLYAGASGSDAPNRWRVDAAKTGEQWKISHINRGNSSR